MLNYKNKYLKYKQKYVNLKKMIGGGIDATYQITGDQLTLNYDGGNETYTILEEEIGKGSYGSVSLIQNNKDKDEDEKQYIFKKGIKKLKTESYDEGIKSEMLKNILDDNMLVLFQGKKESDFLISTYNGKDLYKEFKDEYYAEQKIKTKYAVITTQILELLHTINKNDIFHNDIKLANITIKDEKVYLIDFGLLTKEKSINGSLISMSFNGVINTLINYKYLDYEEAFTKLQKFLNNTDIVGFFYCCIDLLFLTVSDNPSYSNFLLIDLLSFIKGDNQARLNNLFVLFYFILPYLKRIIPELDVNEMYTEYDTFLPSEKIAKEIFSDFNKDHTNLFRFMAYIYNEIELHLIKNKEQKLWYIQFLKIMSACFLPEFNYDKFKIVFNEIVSKFSALPDHIDSVPESTLVPVDVSYVGTSNRPHTI